jgi:peptidoglycan/xylan/chitin deacetylase (PgdA/CDA1 family)
MSLGTIPGELWRAVRVRQRRLEARALILLYHRVNEVSSDPQLLAVTPEHFIEHMETLRREWRPVGMRDLTQALRERTVTSGMVAVTFDDGYADNLYNAKPLLEKYEIPATVFIATGSVESHREFWWDELERLLLQPGTLPDRVRLYLNGSTFEWELQEDAYSDIEGYARHQSWNVETRDDPTLRHGLYRSLCQLVRPLPEEQRQEVLSELATWAGARTMARSTHRPLDAREISQLNEGKLVEIGAHTVSHPVLSMLSRVAQSTEIKVSKAYLEEVMGHPVKGFAYPYGSRSDYTKETVGIVRGAGFGWACSNFAGVASPSTDRYQLPRLLMRDCDGETFAKRLREWVGA